MYLYYPPQGRLSEMEASQEKLRNVIRKLKDDRTHYRTVAEDTEWVVMYSVFCKTGDYFFTYPTPIYQKVIVLLTASNLQDVMGEYVLWGFSNDIKDFKPHSLHNQREILTECHLIFKHLKYVYVYMYMHSRTSH